MADAGALLRLFAFEAAVFGGTHGEEVGLFAADVGEVGAFVIDFLLSVYDGEGLSLLPGGVFVEVTDAAEEVCEVVGGEEEDPFVLNRAALAEGTEQGGVLRFAFGELGFQTFQFGVGVVDASVDGGEVAVSDTFSFNPLTLRRLHDVVMS